LSGGGALPASERKSPSTTSYPRRAVNGSAYPIDLVANRRARQAICPLSTEIVAFSPALGYVVDDSVSLTIGGIERNDRD
jgi:hypothetical protein